MLDEDRAAREAAAAKLLAGRARGGFPLQLLGDAAGIRDGAPPVTTTDEFGRRARRQAAPGPTGGTLRAHDSVADARRRRPRLSRAGPRTGMKLLTVARGPFRTELVDWTDTGTSRWGSHGDDRGEGWRKIEAVEAIKRLKIRYAELNDEGFDPDGARPRCSRSTACGNAGEFATASWGATRCVTTGSRLAGSRPFAHHYITNHVRGRRSVGHDRDRTLLPARPVDARGARRYWMAVRLRRALPQGRRGVAVRGDETAPRVS